MILMVNCGYTTAGNAAETPEKTGNFDVRETRWGMAREDVIEIEKERETVRNTLSQIIYKDTLFSYPVTVAYNFDLKGASKWKLKSIGYSFEQKHENKEEFLKDWDRLVVSLTEKYGMAIEYKEQNDKAQPYTGSNARKDSLNGSATIKMEWRTERTKISASMGSFFGSFNFIVIYEALVSLDTPRVSESSEHNKL